MATPSDLRGYRLDGTVGWRGLSGLTGLSVAADRRGRGLGAALTAAMFRHRLGFTGRLPRISFGISRPAQPPNIRPKKPLCSLAPSSLALRGRGVVCFSSRWGSSCSSATVW